jgi:hypothetical protein
MEFQIISSDIKSMSSDIEIQSRRFGEFAIPRYSFYPFMIPTFLGGAIKE